MWFSKLERCLCLKIEVKFRWMGEKKFSSMRGPSCKYLGNTPLVKLEVMYVETRRPRV
jgi:hypothetical protein